MRIPASASSIHSNSNPTRLIRLIRGFRIRLPEFFCVGRRQPATRLNAASSKADGVTEPCANAVLANSALCILSAFSAFTLCGELRLWLLFRRAGKWQLQEGSNPKKDRQKFDFSRKYGYPANYLVRHLTKQAVWNLLASPQDGARLLKMAQNRLAESYTNW